MKTHATCVGRKGENKTFQHLYFNGQIQLELMPMGTIVQKLQCAGMGTWFHLVW